MPGVHGKCLGGWGAGEPHKRGWNAIQVSEVLCGRGRAAQEGLERDSGDFVYYVVCK